MIENMLSPPMVVIRKLIIFSIACSKRRREKNDDLISFHKTLTLILIPINGDKSQHL